MLNWNTSKSRLKYINTFINVFLHNFISLFNNVNLMIISRNRDQLFYALGIHFAQRVPKSENLLDSNLDYWVASDGTLVIWGSCFLSFNISRVSLAIWPLAEHFILFHQPVYFRNHTFRQYITIILCIHLCISFNNRSFTSFSYHHKNHYLLWKDFNFAK